MRAEMAEAVTSLFAGLGGWHLPPRPLSEAEETKLVDLASLAVRCRSTVERHPYTREIELIPGHEAPGRLVLGLAQLLGGMEVVGVERAEVWRVLRDVALSSMPAVRRTVLEHLVAAEAPCATPAVADALEYPETTVRRALEDLACHAVVVATRGSGKRASYYEVTPWTWERWPSERCVPETPEPASYFSHLVRERISGKQDLDGGAPSEVDEAMAW